MSVGLHRVTLESTSGVPADRIVNDFVINLGAGADVAAAAAASGPLLIAFYNSVAAGAAAALASYLSPVVDRAANKAKIQTYDITDHLAPVVGVGAGSPVATTFFTLGAAGAANPWPDQVAAVLSMAADLTNVPQEAGGGATRPASRRRGRIYLGPLMTNATDAAAVAPRNIGAPLRNDLTKAGLALATALHALAPIQELAVWSRRDGASRAVHSFFADDRLDTQRRRLRKATTRATATVAF